MRAFLSTIISLLLFSLSLHAQMKEVRPARRAGEIDQLNISPPQLPNGIPRASSDGFDVPPFDFRAIPYQGLESGETSLQITSDAQTGLPIFIKGKKELAEYSANALAGRPAMLAEYLDGVKKAMRIESIENAFRLREEWADEQGRRHQKYQQVHNGIKVYGAELLAHFDEESIYAVNGRYYEEPSLETLTPDIGKAAALEIAKTEVGKQAPFKELNEEMRALLDGPQLEAELVVYHAGGRQDAERLAWRVTVRPNVFERWEYFLDGHDGTVLHFYRNSCQLHHSPTGEGCGHPATTGPEAPAEFKIMGDETAVAQDLLNINRTIHVWRHGSTYYMIDASKSMFNSSLSNFPHDPVGVIQTLDAQNIPPDGEGNLNIVPVTSFNNTWGKKSVSAHHNASVAYEYFKNTFGRNSINGQGGNIISFINVTMDGNGFDNAFWNGQAMFYGNGATAFIHPLARALDVAGHEMSHGVIQNTAGLKYENQSGALNESFADIFGAMIDRDDWELGEDVVNPNVFSSGALRSLRDPHNGGNSPSHRGWQPRHMAEFQNLPNTPEGDHGGVHVNSGIPNHAFYLFASQVGKNKAEQIYYKALKDYLFASAQFIDCRNAVIQAATDLHGGNSNEVNQARNAFASVGIGEGGGSNPFQDLEVNPGEDFILHANGNEDNHYIVDLFGNNQQFVSGTDPLRPPSITDDGTWVVFVGEDKRMYGIALDWSFGSLEIIDEWVMQGDPIWRNVTISKDGKRVAALYDDESPMVYVYDFDAQEAALYELYNPTFSQNVTTGDVKYADVIEFDHSGEYLMYDAINEIGSGPAGVEYWDVGFLHVWDNGPNRPGSGTVFKLFAGLPENVSVGNPTFSKNSPYIIAFDHFEEGTFEYYYTIRGANLETGDQGIIREANELGFPSYSRMDDEIIFNFLNGGTDEIIAVMALENNKISTAPGETTYLLKDNARWGRWFGTGVRNLTPIGVGASEEELQEILNIYPNPTSDILNVEFAVENTSEFSIELFSLLGKRVMQATESHSGGSLNLSGLPAGTYILKVSSAKGSFSQKIIKR